MQHGDRREVANLLHRLRRAPALGDLDRVDASLLRPDPRQSLRQPPDAQRQDTGNQHPRGTRARTRTWTRTSRQSPACETLNCEGEKQLKN